jgi:protein-tyrosine phosphatase
MSEPIGPENEPTTYNILFVCTGNTCRSPLSEAIARRMLAERGWSHVQVGSAGIAAYEGGAASEHALTTASHHGLDLGAHETRPLTTELVDWADLILGMGPSHLLAVAEIGGAERAALVTDFLNGEGLGQPVEDPYGSDVAAYERTYAQLEEAIGALLDRLAPILAP